VALQERLNDAEAAALSSQVYFDFVVWYILRGCPPHRDDMTSGGVHLSGVSFEEIL